MNSYPTPAGAAHEERMSPGFLKLHPGAPVHVFTACEDEFFHDHPWPFTSHIAAGSYTEDLLVPQPDGTYQVESFLRAAGTSHHVPDGAIHKLTGLPEGFCVTRAEYGAGQRTPGFYRLLPSGHLEHRYWNEPADAWQPWPRA